MRRQREPDPAPPPGPSPLFQAVVIYGGLALIFSVTLLVESYLTELESRGAEQQALQTASFSGAPVDRPMERLIAAQDEVATIREDFGVEVHILYSPKQYFPGAMRSPPSSARGAQVPLDEFEHVLPALRDALDRYPKQVLRDNLTDIYLVNNLSFLGKDYGGTYQDSAIYINSEGATAVRDELWIQVVLHHELSSILMYNYDFPFETWQAVNEPGFDYPNNAIEMLDRDDSSESNEALLAGGFLRRYASSDMENDINVTAEWLFTRPAELRALAESHDRIARKMRIARDFYQSVDPAISFR